jgi:hypothetical protein
MARKNVKKNAAANPMVRKGRKDSGESSSRLQRLRKPKDAKARKSPLPHDSSSSDDIDEDYAVFLKTYVPEEDLDEDYAEFLRIHNPQKFYHTGYTSEEGGDSQVTTQRDSQPTVESLVKNADSNKPNASK